jgi:L-cysteate sulfo-lyase
MSIDLVEKFERVELGFFPTPLTHLKRASAALNGVNIHIKRDDCTGLAGGGNKTRKLEYLMAAALKAGADCVMTTGGMQSNHCRQTAAAAAKLGLECHLALSDKVDWREDAYRRAGNVTLDYVLGANVHIYDGAVSRDQVCADLVESLRAAGKKPYFVPLGGSNATGALGHVRAYGELQAQLTAQNITPKALYMCSSSGGTHSGLVTGSILAGRPFPIYGVDNEDDPEGIKALVEKIVDDLLPMFDGNHQRAHDDVVVKSGTGGPSYGIPNDKGNAAIKFMASHEGILFDPVYTGKAFARLIADIEAGELQPGDDVVFVHTGGAQALGAYSTLFVK